ncbi:TonB-dependent receptor [Bacteroidales bacterium]|nr:TonB-dependent receptor [Bacteroidales bacterium]
MLLAQDLVKGRVMNEQKHPLTGVNIYWNNTTEAVHSEEDGSFAIAPSKKSKQLIFSYIGHTSDTIYIDKDLVFKEIYLKEFLELGEVTITSRVATTLSSRLTTNQTQRISYEELCRAACCSLAESFETNPSVDVAYTDAATGARQIRLLGLSGKYVQMLTENFPNFRGVAAQYGLDYVPGPWLESILVSKGTSSVKNGYEAIAGQINVEFKKPKSEADILATNLFLGDNGRYEVNLDATALLTPHLSTTILAHYSSEEKVFDMNHDGFFDTPLKRQVNLMNRWEYKKGPYIAQFGLRFLNEDRKGGQLRDLDLPYDSIYRIELKTNRIEVFSKNGYILNSQRNESVALIVSASYHDQQSQYGLRPYEVRQSNIYASQMYERDINKENRLSTGLSINYDRFDEKFSLDLPTASEAFQNSQLSEETVAGAYAEYTLNKNDKFIILAGLRADYSSVYDLFFTPRLHIKYNMFDWMHLRMSAGKGYRTTRVLPENNFYLASSRKMLIDNNLDQEDAWNYGANISFYIPIAGKDLVLNTEWYYTDFKKQVVIDLDADPHAVSFYNLNGKSFASNFQVEATYPFFEGFSATAAYRVSKAKTDYKHGFKEQAFNNKYKALITASYQTALRKWQFDATAQFNGGGRLPFADIEQPLWQSNYKGFTVINAQISKFYRTWSVYLGAENLLDFVQKDPIVSPNNPWGKNFDATMVWGPLHGRKIYLGMRYNIPRL